MINSDNISGTDATKLMKDLQVKVDLESQTIPIGKDKYSLDEIKKQKALEEQIKKAKELAMGKMKEGTEWKDCFTLAVINSKKNVAKTNTKKSVKNESAEGEEETESEIVQDKKEVESKALIKKLKTKGELH